jgi:hypothetical protein
MHISIYFYIIHLKQLQHAYETSETFETYACIIHFQQNLAGRRAEHCTTGSSYAVVVEKEDGSEQAAMGPSMSGCVVPGNRACAVPQTSGARGGGDNSNRVGAASRGEAASAVRSWGSTPRWWR